MAPPEGATPTTTLRAPAARALASYAHVESPIFPLNSAIDAWQMGIGKKAKRCLKTAKLLALLATVRTDDSCLTFLPTNQITFYEHSVIQQVMISTEFLPIEKSLHKII